MLYGLILVFGFNLCVIRMTVMDYRPFKIDLDSNYELDITTYPEGYPTDVGFNKMMSADAIYLQMHLKDKREPWRLISKEKMASIDVHSFVYQMDDGPKVELLRDSKSHIGYRGVKKNLSQYPIDQTVSWLSQSISHNQRRTPYDSWGNACYRKSCLCSPF